MTTAVASVPLAEARAPRLALSRAELLKLRKRRGLVAMVAALTVLPMLIGVTVTSILHANDPAKHPSAGGIENFAGSMEMLGTLAAIAAVIVGVTAGAGDLSAGVFRTLVVTGRSRLRLFAARIPGGLALILPFVAVGVTIAAVASLALAGSAPQPDGGFIAGTAAWIALQVAGAFAIGLGVGSLFGSRGMAIGAVLGWMLALEPLLLAINVLGSLRIGLLGAATQRLEPTSPLVEPGGPAVGMSAGAAAIVVALWALIPLFVGAWRTATRDA
jgi:ABC-type transport system involved in multi-copper enzyme maturation permease subunit